MSYAGANKMRFNKYETDIGYTYITSDGNAFRTKQEAQDYLKSQEYINSKKKSNKTTHRNPFDE